MTVIGPKRWHVAAVAVLLGCMRTTAAAKSCVPTPGMPHEPVAASVWGDTARFSFLVGRDFDDPGSNTALIVRLRTFGDYPALRADANAVVFGRFLGGIRRHGARGYTTRSCPAGAIDTRESPSHLDHLSC